MASKKDDSHSNILADALKTPSVSDALKGPSARKIFSGALKGLSVGEAMRGPAASEILGLQGGTTEDKKKVTTNVVVQALGETLASLTTLENQFEASEERLSTVEKSIPKIAESVSKELKGKFVPTSMKKELEDLKRGATKAIVEFTNAESNREKIALDAIDAHAKELSNQKDRFEEIYARAKAFAKYEQLDKYFAKKMSDHKKLHYNWLILFVGIIALSLSVVWDGRDAISGWLPTWTKEEFTFGKSVLLIAPFLGVSWVLRICMRLSMLNLQLSEDAGNKTVLLRTLAALESDDTTTVEKEQRLVAYNAIFRSSLPDNSNLDIAQPGIAELAKFGK